MAFNYESPHGRAGQRRWRSLAVVLLGGALLAAGCYFFPWKDNGPRTAALVATAGLTALGLAWWIAVRSGAPGIVKAVVLLPVAGLVASVKVTGCTGDIVPEFSWRWSDKQHRGLAAGDRVVEPIADAAQLSGAGETDFPQFLGPARDGAVGNVTLDTNWTANPPREHWRLNDLGAAFSAFAVAGDFAFTQELRGTSSVVSCYERRTGKLRWRHDQQESPFESVMGGDGPRATPTVADGRVYALGARGRLECLDAADGHAVWSVSLAGEFNAPLPTWAKSCSPLVTRGLVIVSVGAANEHSLVAFAADTGKVRWHAGDSPSSYATPVLATLRGLEQVVILNAQDVTSHDLATGKVLWSWPWPGIDPKVPQPIAVGEDRVLLSAGYGLGCHMLAISRDGDAWDVRDAWSSRALKPKFTNLVVHDGHAYGLDDGRALVCLGLDDGKVRWKSGRYGHGQVLLIGNTLLVQTEDGELVLVEANPADHRELARFQALSDRTWNPPAFSPPYLLVRNHLEAACFELKLK